jgi:hypothetical protein
MASTLDTTTCGEGLITNRAGVLACKQSNQPDLLQGSYLESCEGCSLQEGVLACTACRNAAGAEVASELREAATCALIGNADGHLECQDSEGRRLESDPQEPQQPAEEEAPAVQATVDAEGHAAPLKDEP